MANTLAEALEIMDESQMMIIDNDLRTIKVPSGFILGVYNDKDTHNVTFRMPKTYSGFDLSKFQIRINYNNALGHSDQHIVEENDIDTTSDEDYIYFNWLVGATAYEAAGNVKFVVCLILTDGNGMVTNEFNTTITNVSVLQGHEVGARSIKENVSDFYTANKKLADQVDKVSKDFTQKIKDLDIEHKVGVKIDENDPEMLVFYYKD